MRTLVHQHMLPGRIAHHQFYSCLVLGKFLLCVTGWSRTSYVELALGSESPPSAFKCWDWRWTTISSRTAGLYWVETALLTSCVCLSQQNPGSLQTGVPKQLIRRLCDIIVLQLTKNLDLWKGQPKANDHFVQSNVRVRPGRDYLKFFWF